MMPLQDTKEELLNSITHGIGAILSIAGLVLMIVFSAQRGTVWHVVSTSIFGSMLVILYLASTIYHSVTHERIKNVILRRLDHMSIYLLIAGTYTPFTLTVLRGPWGWSLFGVIWGLAIIGVLLKLFCGPKFDLLSTIGYLVMGWLILIATKPLTEKLAFGGLLWLTLGGLAYSLGCFFYLQDQKYRFFHAYWHVMVLLGSLCHFFAVFFYLIP